jgi:hypothetical protein
MKKLFLLLVIALPLIAQNGRVQVKQFKNQASDSVAVTYVNSQIDTVIWYRTEPAVSAISFAAQWEDTVRTATTSSCVIKRIYGQTIKTTAGDTLAWSSIASVQTQVNGTFLTGFALNGTPTFAPYADAYVFIVSYHSAGNSHVSRGKKVKYIVEKLYSGK